MSGVSVGSGGGDDGGQDEKRIELLERSREREKAQTLLYRALAAEAADRGDDQIAERLNELHADEQHHLSRITARVLELGGRPAELAGRAPPAVAYDEWPYRAREREEEEVAWYSALLDEEVLDGETRAVLAEILGTERSHRDHLGGKWMPA